MKKHLISLTLLLITVQATQAQLIISQKDNNTVADFRNAFLYKGGNIEDHKELNIVTFESRTQDVNGTSPLYSSECIAVYNISYIKDKIRIKRNVIESASQKNSKNSRPATPDLTKKLVNRILAEGTRSINTKYVPVTTAMKEGTTELTIDNITGKDTISTKTLGIVTTLESAKEKLTYASQENTMYIDNLLKINATVSMKSNGGDKNKEYNSTDNVYENIYIIQIDKTDCDIKEYIKGLKVNLKSLREYIAGKGNMNDGIKKEICDILKKQGL
ncbi:hypothetical protein HPS54_03780 [Prevotella sp. PCHR]|uniref:Uncharacterized protein n=1 Tax=Xylanibacter caecicola TaxID=2736294 RepID=A0ABX2B033_9BACT|nr:hypothetical protein [Xylanibacter caecicola]NPE24643.1 hypothetical protein [Xylanibacter caecicola]